MARTERKLSVSINSPEEVIWQGIADSVSSTNTQGSFDVLPEHAHFITIVDNEAIVIRNGSEELRFNFYYSVLHAENNNVHIFAHI